MIARILIALESKNARRQLKRFLSGPGVIAENRPPEPALWKQISAGTYDLVAVDLDSIPKPVEAILGQLQTERGAPAVVIIADSVDGEERPQLLQAGCAAVLPRGLPMSEMAGVIKTLLDKQVEVHREALALRQVQEPRLEDFVSKSPIMGDFMDLVRRVVPSKTSLLLLGETGVGKERLARAIHRASGRNGAFVAVNLGALPESLLESELFGHEEGAFTGASRARRGCFELAHRGTIFLDEIGEMPTHLQVRLLRVIQEREVQRVGAEWPVPIDVRIMAATSRDLDELVTQGLFRSDLIYRLGVVTLKVPPLRERREDIPDLVESYINHFSAEVVREVSGIDPEALDVLGRYDWPGNVREMINVIERATLLCSGPRISLSDLPHAISQAAGNRVQLEAPDLTHPPVEWLTRSLKEVRDDLLERLERAYLHAQLQATSGRVGDCARRAGITPRALYDKMRRYDLRKENYRNGRS